MKHYHPVATSALKNGTKGSIVLENDSKIAASLRHLVQLEGIIT